MKIIHCADLHLDSKMTANLTKEQAKERKNEILRTFTRMVDYAKKNSVKAILITVDIYIYLDGKDDDAHSSVGILNSHTVNVEFSIEDHVYN